MGLAAPAAHQKPSWVLLPEDLVAGIVGLEVGVHVDQAGILGHYQSSESPGAETDYHLASVHTDRATHVLLALHLSILLQVHVFTLVLLLLHLTWPRRQLQRQQRHGLWWPTTAKPWSGLVLARRASRATKPLVAHHSPRSLVHGVRATESLLATELLTAKSGTLLPAHVVIFIVILLSILIFFLITLL